MEIAERGRMTPKWNGMDKNGTAMYRNEPEWRLNETGINTNMVGSTWKGQIKNVPYIIHENQM